MADAHTLNRNSRRIHTRQHTACDRGLPQFLPEHSSRGDSRYQRLNTSGLNKLLWDSVKILRKDRCVKTVLRYVSCASKTGMTIRHHNPVVSLIGKIQVERHAEFVGHRGVATRHRN